MIFALKKQKALNSYNLNQCNIFDQVKRILTNLNSKKRIWTTMNSENVNQRKLQGHLQKSCKSRQFYFYWNINIDYKHIWYLFHSSFLFCFCKCRLKSVNVNRINSISHQKLFQFPLTFWTREGFDSWKLFGFTIVVS